METTTHTKTVDACAVNPPPDNSTQKKEGVLKKLVRRVREVVKPTHCSVRYDTSKALWAEVNPKTGEPIRHFTHGVLSNVTFSSLEQRTNYTGCGGGSKVDYAGIATGDLVSDSYGRDTVGYHNLSFNGRNFVNENGAPLERASSVKLLSNRRSMYKE